jgi:uncharacterized SAM-binding protein YcdF (DUF218 family)
MTNILGTLLVPSGLIAVLLILGLVLMCFSSRRRIGRMSVLVAACMYLVFSWGPTAYALLRPLEDRYRAVVDPNELESPKSIIVLAGYAANNPALPPTDRISYSAAYRVLAALWLASSHPDTRVIVSGSGSSATGLSDALIAAGLADHRIDVDALSTDTAHSGKNVKADLPCVLVTSAGHMPRAMAAFQAQGISCTAAPVEFYTKSKLGPFDYLPQPYNLRLSDLAMHEYLALVFYRLTGRI